jgi:hypothetical protein
VYLMTGSALFTIEESHGKPRLTQPRPSDVGTVETGSDRRVDHDAQGRFTPGNRAAADRSARRALTAPLRAALTRVRAATEAEPVDVRDRLLADAMAVYSSTRRELGSRSTMVLWAVSVFASEGILAAHYLERATEVGLESPEGERLHARSQTSQTQAARAMTSALAAAKALGGKRKAKRTVPPAFTLDTTGDTP